MSRVMKVLTHSAAYSGSVFEPILAPPGEKKYELLTLSIWGDATGGIAYYPTVDRDGELYIADEQTTEVGQFAVCFRFNALCLEDGDTLKLFAPSGSGFWAAHMTFVDVDTAP